MSTKSEWTVAVAKQRLSELLRAASRRPQVILNRDRPVAVVLDIESFAEYQQWRREQARPSLDQTFEELRAICADESGELPRVDRKDRADRFAESLDDLPR